MWAPSTPAGTGACPSNQYVTAVNPGSTPTCATSVYYPTSAPTHQYSNGMDTNGWLTYAQPSFADLAGTASPGQLPSATASAQGAVQLAGDIAGTAAVPKVSGLQGKAVSSTTPSSTNQFLGWTGTQWAATQPSFANISGAAASSQLPQATASALGGVTLAGDFGGTAIAPIVDGL